MYNYEYTCSKKNLESGVFFMGKRKKPVIKVPIMPFGAPGGGSPVLPDEGA